MKKNHSSGNFYSNSRTLTDRLVRYAALFSLAVAVITLLGWIFDITFFKSIKSSWAAIRANTSIAFIFASIALLFTCSMSRLHWFISKFASLIVLLIGGITVAEYVFNWNSGIDELLFKDNTTVGTGVPGRMSPFAAINFVLLGLCLLIHDHPYRLVAKFINILALVTFALGLLQFNAYLFGISHLYRSWGVTHMSFSASVLYMVLAIGLIVHTQQKSFLFVFLKNTKTARIALKQLVSIFLLLLLISWLRVLGQNQGYYPTEIGVSLVVVASFLIVATILRQGTRIIAKGEEKQLSLTEHLSRTKEELSMLNRDLEKEILIRKKKELDISALNNNLERKVQERTSQLHQINKELEAFSYSVSHDLRAPLRAVNGYASILLEDHEKALNDDGKRLLNTIVNNGKMMGRLIDDLLKFSRLGRLEVVNESVDMNKLVQECSYELQLQNPKLTYTLDPEQLPPVRGDERMLKQVWFNLLDNAIKYSSKTTNANIYVGCKQDDAQFIFYVKDNGAGFDMQYADKLFGVFQRLHQHDEFEGSGVGLALVQRIIIKHKGSIWAESEPAKGSTFYFSMPKKNNNE